MKIDHSRTCAPPVRQMTTSLLAARKPQLMHHWPTRTSQVMNSTQAFYKPSKVWPCWNLEARKIESSYFLGFKLPPLWARRSYVEIEVRFETRRPSTRPKCVFRVPKWTIVGNWDRYVQVIWFLTCGIACSLEDCAPKLMLQAQRSKYHPLE